ncbi:TolC family protein [Panacibacter ginsenosidivorans]|uniref:TolC family protein n=1 Tax=Panacibacter ginsenosidivorans TaxID=1813871 RepID=A0A5B8V9X1_9BACT|nr:TolC family protein [Panacibacter ginsenosidivorans]QEC68132.1 TolC family protein [Panacibacter ginsenosidivorans]
MNWRKGFIIGLFVLSVKTQAQDQKQNDTIHTFSVKQCVDFAAKNNVQVKNAITDLKEQVQTNRGITSAALPNVAASGSLTDYLKIPTNLLPGEFFGQPAGTFIPVKFGTQYNANAALTLQQVVFDGQVFVGLQARKTAVDFYTKNIDVVLENVKSNIYKVYYQLVASNTQIAQIDANIERLTKLEHDANELFKNGFAEKIDVDKASVQLANLQTEKQSALNQIANGYLGLKLLMGMSVKDSLVLTDSISDEKVKEGLLNEGVYDYKSRVEYQYAELGKRLNEFNVKRYKLSALPTLRLNGDYSKNAQRTRFDVFGKGDWFTTAYVGLNLNLSLFDGFARKSNLEKAKLDVQKSNDQIDFLKLSIDKEVEEATNNFRNAVNTLDFQKKNIELAEKVYEQSKKKYEIGTGSTTEITNAQTDLRIAQNNYINALYTAIIAKVDYLKATGKL